MKEYELGKKAGFAEATSVIKQLLASEAAQFFLIHKDEEAVLMRKLVDKISEMEK